MDFVISTEFNILINIDILRYLYRLAFAKTSIKKADRSKTFASTNLLSFPFTVAWSFDDLIVEMVPFRC